MKFSPYKSTFFLSDMCIQTTIASFVEKRNKMHYACVNGVYKVDWKLTAILEVAEFPFEIVSATLLRGLSL